MKLCRFLGILLLALALLGATWADLSTGKSSYATLADKDFSVSVPLLPAPEGSRVVLFNRREAEELGLELPESTAETQNLIMKDFGYVVDPKEQSPKTGLATRYTSQFKITLKSSLGDGRAVVLGEVSEPDARGESVPLEISVKGVGQTPLAWTAHSDPAHSDGLLDLHEAIADFIYSEANYRNGLSTNRDLGVIELPIKKLKAGRETKTALLIRVGPQIRLGHLVYHMHKPENFKLAMDYVIRRELKLEPGTPITGAHVKRYLRFLASNLADQSARLLDLDAVHGSPTLDNMTTDGSLIDMGTFRYLDAHHSEYKYLFDRKKLGGPDGQVQQMKSYLDYLTRMMKGARYPGAPNVAYLLDLNSEFDSRFVDTFTKLNLKRVGLSESEIEKIPERLKLTYAAAVRDLLESKGTKKIVLPDRTSIYPAAFDDRKVFANAARAQSATGREWDRRWDEAFHNERSWASPESPEARKARLRYIAAYENLTKSLHPTREDFKRWENSAVEMNPPRPDPGKDFFYGPSKFSAASDVIQAIEKGESFEKVQQKAEKAIGNLVDGRGVPAVAENLAQESSFMSCLRRHLESLTFGAR